jgi:ATP-binding cassette, subfamily B, bacterial
MSDADEEARTPYWRLEDDAPRTESPWRLVRRVATAARPVLGVMRQAAPRSAVAVVVLQLGAGLAASFGLLATADVLSRLFAAGPTADRVVAALPALVAVLAAYAGLGALNAAVSFANARLAPSVRRVAEERLVAAGLGVRVSAYDDHSFYDRMHRARDRGLLHMERATDNVVELLGSAVAVVAATVTLGILHPVLVLVLAAAMLPEGWAVLRSARLEYANMTRTATLIRRIWLIVDLASNKVAAPEIRACQAEPFVLGEYRGAADALRDHEIGLGVAQARARTVGRAMTGVGLGATYLALGLMLHGGWIALAVAGAAVIAIRTATAALTRLVVAGNHLVEQGLYIADYEEFLADARARTRPARGLPAPAQPRRIELDRVAFRYTGAPGPALADISLAIDAGQTVALVGENGSGKTTLAKVIAGLYQPTAGRVAWDGVDIGEFDPVSFADKVVMVLQEPVRWPHTARTNVRLGRHDRADPDDTSLRDAATRSGADEVVDALPDGWDTLLSTYFRGGRELSGGQWQRLAVARGLYRDAPVLIWDEPTAPLDAKAEYAVYESLRRLAHGRTVILITHRLASVRHADRIFLLHHGELVEHGTHTELLARDGRYAELFRLQAEMFADAAR